MSNTDYTAAILPERIEIDCAEQQLYILRDNKRIAQYRISTGKNGVGEQQDSGCTPRGLHRIVEKYGANMPINSVFVARRSTGEQYTPELAQAHPNRDWILTRILRLEGCEPGKNQGKGCDSYERYIYIHGTPDGEKMGEPLSHGCIRMCNNDIVTLFERVEIGTPVMIYESMQTQGNI